VYIVTEISASPDGSPFVFITLRDPSEVRGPQKTSPASPAVTFGSMDDMFRNLGRVISKQMIVWMSMKNLISRLEIGFP